MFSPIEISYYKSQLESQRNKMTQEHWDTMKYYPNHCTPLIESIYNLKNELIKQIIEDSGWDYDGKHFIYKSNYNTPSIFAPQYLQYLSVGFIFQSPF